MKSVILGCFLIFQSVLFGQEVNSKKSDKDTVPQTTKLEEVVLVNKKRAITYEHGNVNITVENTPLAAMATPIDILSKLPTIILSPDQESLEVVGKGAPLIYLNNQRITLLELLALSVDAIKTITIINNPSAKYEAEGRAVLEIILKKQHENGFKATFSEVVASKRRFNNYASIYMALKKGRFEYKGSFAYNQLYHWESNGSNFDVESQNFKQQYLVNAIGPRPQFILGSGLYYKMNGTTYLSAAANLKTQQTDIPIRTATLQQTETDVSAIKTFSDQQEHRDIFRSNINFNKSLKNGNLFIGGQYAYYLRNLDSRIANQFDLSDFQLSQIRDQDNRIDNIVMRFDLDYTFKNDLKLELGSAITYAQSKAFSDFRFLDTSSSEEFRYTYKEDNYASYFQASGKYKKVNYSGGVRAETTFVMAGFQTVNRPLIDRKNTKIFPKAELEIPLGNSTNIVFNYAKTIQRPKYRDAIALNTFINPFLDWTTNLSLLPTITHEVSTNVQYKKQGIRLSYDYKKNPAYVVVNLNGDSLVMSTQNFEQETTWQLQFQNSYGYRFWNISSIVSLLWDKISDRNAIVSETKPYLYGNMMNEFSIGSKTTLTVDFWGLTKQQKGVFEYNALAVFGASLTQKISEQLILSINTNDIFRAMNFEDRYKYNTINTVTTYFADAQQLSFSAKYTLGGLKKTTYKNKEVNDALDRIQ